MSTFPMLARRDGERSPAHDRARLTHSRRTGLTLPQQKLDEHGLEEVSDLFSSPKKPSPLKQMFTAADVDEGESDSTEMSGMDSTLCSNRRRIIMLSHTLNQIQAQTNHPQVLA